MKQHASAETLVDTVIGRLGRRVVLGLPVGIGKANRVANALFRRAVADPSLDLTIFTGLTLSPPTPAAGLEQRFVGPIAERLYANWPELEYERARTAGALPANVSVREFYLRPGGYLANAGVQQAYTSINYSRVATELMDLGVNVIAQLVAPSPDGAARYSLASNPEVTLDLLPQLEQRRDRPYLLIGEVNRQLPYMYGEAEIDAESIDCVLDNETTDYPLFALPNRPVSPADFAAGMHVASLVPDGGTLQVGIGSMSDAVAHCLRLRNENPDVFRAVLRKLPGGTGSDRRRVLPVEDGPFRLGLYGCTELLSDAIFSLFRAGIVSRAADEEDDAAIHAGFFIGSNGLYDGLREMPAGMRRRIAMRRISFVNTLYGDEARKRAQRRDARFVNETMMVTLLGAAVSDALGDGRVVSGIGGQFDFVDMAGDLPSAQSILMLRASRLDKGRPSSNLRWSYPHTSVPRQHRDVFVTEYGIAATRGRPDSEVVDALLGIADARFRDELLASARAARKVPAGYRPEAALDDNRPETIESVFREPELAAFFPRYPLGSELTPVEQDLAAALQWLRERSATVGGRIDVLRGAVFRRRASDFGAALERLSLAAPDGLRERLVRRLVCHALEETRQ